MTPMTVAQYIGNNFDRSIFKDANGSDFWASTCLIPKPPMIGGSAGDYLALRANVSSKPSQACAAAPYSMSQ